LGEEQSAPVVKKPKTKVIKKVEEKTGWVSNAVIDEEGKEIEKPKPEEKAPKVKQQQQPTITSKKEKISQSNNIYTFAADENDEDIPTQSEYQSSLRDRKPQPQQPPKKNPVRKPAEKNKENGEKKPKEDEKKKKGNEKPKKVERRPPPPAATASILQNELIRPLFYVFVFVTLISVLYLVLN